MVIRKLLVAFTLIAILAAIPFTVLAGSATKDGITLTTPDSEVTCTPSGTVSTSGVGSNTVNYWFFVHDATTNTMITLGSGSMVGDFSLPFPYPASIGGSMTFVATIQVGTTKLSHQWTITCEPPTGAQGCTPGYWRNHYQSWPAPYTPDTSFNTAFEVGANFWAPGFFSDSYTMADGIWQGGGGLNRLARHGTAALLSAASDFVDYPYSVAQVIAMVQLGTIDPLAAANELGCPLN